ncbi:MAG: M23 family metallopeptidase [Thermoanaerobaculia bacterium]|nr:MAG: M23 family metallopeptidase [Thermoanaerobaculia bacterium]
MRLSLSTDSIRLRRRRSRLRLVLALIAVAGLALAALGAFRTGPAPAIEIRPARAAIGRATTVEVEVAEPARGLATVRIELDQNGAVVPLAEERFAPLAGWRLWGARTPSKRWHLEVGKQAQPALVEGEATIRVVATRAPAWLRAGAPASAEVRLPVRLTAPSLAVLSSQHYVAQGGSEVVVYRVGRTSVSDGVEVGDWYFPGYPLPGGAEGERFALFAVPWDEPGPERVKLIAADEVGNARSASFVDQFFPFPPRQATVQLEVPFLERVVAEIRDNTPELPDRGELVANYLEINRELRKANAAALRALAAKSRAEFLWRAGFLALPGGQVMSSFADHRSYRYGGREIDQEYHLGFDLASVARADVPAANDGVVVLARYFGIYGNTVVLDHGYGLMTLYSHLSSIAVEDGEAVKRGQVIGRSGMTGLAGGDHLHFSFLLQGLPVRPVEWWDAHWIGDRMKRKLGPALPWSG